MVPKTGVLQTSWQVLSVTALVAHTSCLNMLSCKLQLVEPTATNAMSCTDGHGMAWHGQYHKAE